MVCRLLLLLHAAAVRYCCSCCMLLLHITGPLHRHYSKLFLLHGLLLDFLHVLAACCCCYLFLLLHRNTVHGAAAVLNADACCCSCLLHILLQFSGLATCCIFWAWVAMAHCRSQTVLQLHIVSVIAARCCCSWTTSQLNAVAGNVAGQCYLPQRTFAVVEWHHAFMLLPLNGNNVAIKA